MATPPRLESHGTAWTLREDELLRQAIRRYPKQGNYGPGGRNAKLAEHIGTRSSRQVISHRNKLRERQRRRERRNARPQRRRDQHVARQEGQAIAYGLLQTYEAQPSATAMQSPIVDQASVNQGDSDAERSMESLFESLWSDPSSWVNATVAQLAPEQEDSKVACV